MQLNMRLVCKTEFPWFINHGNPPDCVLLYHNWEYENEKTEKSEVWYVKTSFFSPTKTSYLYGKMVETLRRFPLKSRAFKYYMSVVQENLSTDLGIG